LRVGRDFRQQVATLIERRQRVGREAHANCDIRHRPLWLREQVEKLVRIPVWTSS
jgi:hypothetical protein